MQKLKIEFDSILSEMHGKDEKLLLDDNDNDNADENDADADAEDNKADADYGNSILYQMNGRDGKAAAALAEKLSLVICGPNISFPDFAFVNPGGFNKING